jgi:hypothetical protein
MLALRGEVEDRPGVPLIALPPGRLRRIAAMAAR